jgi:chromosome segregation ATPase
MAKDAEFAGMIAIARQAQQEHEMEKCIELADSATPEDWQVKRLQIWARHWRASRMIPKKWGDKITQEIDGLIAKVNTLKQSESDTSGSIVRLTEQAVKLETKSKVLTDEINTAELQLSELNNKQKQFLSELIELQKVKNETENSNGTNSATLGSSSAG